jgi:hypothetical protein
MFGGKSRKQVTQMENEYKKLQLQFMTTCDQMENFRKIAFKYQSEYIQLTKAVKSLCMTVLDGEFALSQLGGGDQLANMDIFSLISYTQKNFYDTRAKDREMLIHLTKNLDEKQREIEGLKAQISRYLVKEKQKEEFGDTLVSSSQPAEKQEEAETSAVVMPEITARPKIETPAPKVKTSPAHEQKKGIMRMMILDDEDEEGKDKPAAASKEEFLHQRNQSETPRSQDKPVVENKNYLKKEESSAMIQKTEAQSSQEEKIMESVAQRTEELKSSDVMAHVVDLKDYIDKMDDVMWSIVRVIGKDGLSESKDIKKVILKEKGTESAFNTALTKLRSMQIIDQERINTGWRWFNSYELSDTGKRIYLEKYKENPVECEKQILKKEHTTALHGYCIKDAAYILQAVFQYDEACTKRRQNTIKLPSGVSYIPDIVAKKKKGALVDYFEVELGHHTQKDFNDKCDKMRAVTSNLYFIVPDADTMNNKLAKQIGQWVLEKGGKDKLKGITIYLTTLTKLNEGKFENIYPF